jgi:hypothetical protein
VIRAGLWDSILRSSSTSFDGDNANFDTAGQGFGNPPEHFETVAAIVGVFEAADHRLGCSDSGRKLFLREARLVAHITDHPGNFGLFSFLLNDLHRLRLSCKKQLVQDFKSVICFCVTRHDPPLENKYGVSDSSETASDSESPDQSLLKERLVPSSIHEKAQSHYVQ